MNRLTTGDYKTIAPENWENLNDNNGFYNFADYKPFLFDGKALNDAVSYTHLDVYKRQQYGRVTAMITATTVCVSIRIICICRLITTRCLYST